MQWYYCPDLSTEEVQIAADEAHHLVHVVRMQAGEELLLTNGCGILARAVIQKASAKDCRALITERSEIAAPTEILHLAFAPTKNIDRTEWMLEKATEMGVQYLTPLRCRHSERKEINVDRLHKIMVAAAKQSRRAWFPVLHPLQQFHEFVAANTNPAFIAHCNPAIPRSTWKDYLNISGTRTLLIGPEGDFSEEEILLANQCGISGLDLGHRRLRTETAAMAVCFPLLLNSVPENKSA
jgi:16S rRNA (uracil1498-N3)-methyltransferase